MHTGHVRSGPAPSEGTCHARPCPLLPFSPFHQSPFCTLTVYGSEADHLLRKVPIHLRMETFFNEKLNKQVVNRYQPLNHRSDQYESKHADQGLIVHRTMPNTCGIYMSAGFPGALFSVHLTPGAFYILFHHFNRLEIIIDILVCDDLIV